MTAYPVKAALDGEDLHAFRFNVKPDNVSTTEPGQLTIQSVHEGGQAVAEFPSTSDDKYYYTGQAQTAQDVDCVLVWDDRSKSYTLHALTSITKLTKTNKKPPKPAVGGQRPAQQRQSTVSPHNAAKQSAPVKKPQPPPQQPQQQQQFAPDPRPAQHQAPADLSRQATASPPEIQHQAPSPDPEPEPAIQHSQAYHVDPSHTVQQPQRDSSDEEESSDESDSQGDSDESEDFGDLASQMELGVST